MAQNSVQAVRVLEESSARAERLVCRYLAHLADRVEQGADRELGSYSDVYHAAGCDGTSEAERSS